MKRRAKAGGKGVKTGRRKAATSKRRRGPPEVARGRHSAAGPQTVTARLTRERDEALEREKATAEVLRVISSSSGNLQTVFQTILENATRLCEAKFGTLFRFDGKLFHLAAQFGTPRELSDLQRRRGPFEAKSGDSTAPLERLARTKQVVHFADEAAEAIPGTAVTLGGARSTIRVPLLKDGLLIGALIVYRQEVRPFTQKQIELVQSFAAQAVIAIENTRLLNELRESLLQQTATADVLKVISSSPGELEPVFQAMLEKATLICEAKFGTLYRFEEGNFQVAALFGSTPELIEAQKRRGPFTPTVGTLLDRLMRTKEVSHTADYAAERAQSLPARLGGARSTVAVPLVKDGALVGAFAIYRQEPRPFTDKQIELVKNFAAQAVIAIENARLLNELRQRTDDLAESLEQQTATSEVLRVISSSPGQLEPVFQVILENAVRICDAKFGNLWVREGDKFRIVAMHGASQEYRAALFSEPFLQCHPQSAGGRVVSTRQVVQIDDVSTAPTYGEKMRTATIEIAKARTLVTVPMLKEREVVGIIAIYRQEVRPFIDKQIDLLRNFAAQAVIAIENTRLLSELRESLQQQTATADVLKVISRSTFDLQRVLNTLVESAARLCEADSASIHRPKGDVYPYVASYGFSREFGEYMRERPLRADRATVLGRVVLGAASVHVIDILADPEWRPSADTSERHMVSGGGRSILGVPLLREGVSIGVIIFARSQVRPFTDKQIELAATFADQAVIAIENARLFEAEQQRTRQLSESLEQQTATSEVLRIISLSPGELAPVFQSMLENATRICEAKFGTLFRFDGEKFHLGAQYGTPAELTEFQRRRGAFTPQPGVLLDVVMRTKRLSHIADSAAEPMAGVATTLGGARSIVAVPMLKDEELIGAIVIYRQEVRPFTDKQIALLENFAAQAVIAIENTRLLSELRESLQQQTATADVLKVISSSPGELQPVFQAMLQNAVRICDAKFGVLNLCDDDGFRAVALHDVPEAYVESRRGSVLRPSAEHPLGRLMRAKRTIHIDDIQVVPKVARGGLAELAGARTMVNVPMLKEDELIGAISIYRQDVRPFTGKQMDLLTNFAAQAVIAIENARLLNELRESLEQQTATSEVLRTISNSPGDLEPVFQAMLENATRICDAKFGSLYLRVRDGFRIAAMHNAPPAYEALRRSDPVMDSSHPAHQALLGRLAKTKEIVQISDLMSAPPEVRGELANFAGARTVLAVPMLKEDELIGAIAIYRQEVRPFTDKHIEMVSNFAKQAAIAIENTRLLSELRESLQQQTATADVLKVISRSTFDLQPVFDSMAESAARLCEAERAYIFRFDGKVLRAVASFNAGTESQDWVYRNPIPLGRHSVSARAGLERRTVQVADIQADPEYHYVVRDIDPIRTTLAVPMLKGDDLIGTITIYRLEVKPFTENQTALMETFADQAVIAIENARLFEAEQQRTKELAKSLEDLRTAQDRLVQTQKLASLGQLTAGIAHEIKNPLNFVNNFSGVSVELIDELRQTLGGIRLEGKAKAEIAELTDTLRDNLDKITQHGRRADAIVKNMLMHSREGSGEHRPVDINALVEESLNLAYHGARAEKQGFNITLKRAFDPAAGEADVYPQDISRVLINLISNGFYAATKRHDEKHDGYEPTLTAATKNLGDRVEIRIRDNGTGIPPEVREKMFNPFFTTKPAGEGTGLGLSISHDIVVKQHSGSIEVDTVPGEFTEFRIILPRAAA